MIVDCPSSRGDRSAVPKALRDRLFCAVDTSSGEVADRLASNLEGVVGGFKVGLEFFCALGREGVAVLRGHGRPVFLDLKFHDIPATVAAAVRSVAPLGPAFLTVHASGGIAMMRAAAAAAQDVADPPPALLAVTLLTSLSSDDLRGLGCEGAVSDHVRALAVAARNGGMRGVVCSPHEVALLRKEMGDDFVLAVPGLRPEGADAADHGRVATPRYAYDAGADLLIVGRPVTEADDPRRAASDVVRSLSADRPLLGAAGT